MYFLKKLIRLHWVLTVIKECIQLKHIGMYLVLVWKRKNLVCEKEETKCSNILKLYKND